MVRAPRRGRAPALIVFLLEGRSLIDTEVRPGLWVVIGATLVLTATHVTVARRTREEVP